MEEVGLVLVVIALCLIAFMLGAMVGIYLGGRRYRHAFAMIDRSVFERFTDGDGAHDGAPHVQRRAMRSSEGGVGNER